jgi:hypothetical protein
MKVAKVKGANLDEIKADLKAKGLKFKDEDVDDIVAKSITLRDVVIDGKPKKVRVRLDTLQAVVDDNNEVVAWIYGEEEVAP